MIDRSGILKWEEKGPIGVIKIDSGTPTNAIPKPDFADLNTIKQWVEQQEIKGVIVTGEGRHFCSGADLKYFEGQQLDSDAILRKFDVAEDVLSYFENLEKPIIAAVNGVCLGGGLEIALACHMRFCSKGAVFGFPEITHGVIPGYGGIQRLYNIVGRSRTLEIILTGDTFNAEYACEQGIANDFVNEKSCLNHAEEFINRVAEMGAKPVAYAIRSVNNANRMDYSHAIKEECRMFVELVIDQYKDGGDHIG